MSPCKSISGTQGSAASEVAAAADDPEVERMELLALRRELRERERRLHEREQHLQSKEAVIQVCCSLLPAVICGWVLFCHSEETAATPKTLEFLARQDDADPARSMRVSFYILMLPFDLIRLCWPDPSICEVSAHGKLKSAEQADHNRKILHA